MVLDPSVVVLVLVTVLVVVTVVVVTVTDVHDSQIFASFFCPFGLRTHSSAHGSGLSAFVFDRKFFRHAFTSIL